MNPATFEAIAVCLRSIVGDEEFAAHKFRRPFNLHLADDADADADDVPTAAGATPGQVQTTRRDT